MGEKKLRINIATFDFFKGIGMISVVIGHMSHFDYSTSGTLRVIYSILTAYVPFVLPFFLFISGFGFKPKTVKKMLKSTASAFLIPYAWVALFVAILFPPLRNIAFHNWTTAIYEDARYMLAFFFGLPSSVYPHLLGIGAYEASVVYFLLAIFWGHNLLNLILKVKNEMLQWILAILCLPISLCLYRISFYFYSLPVGFLVLPICFLGYQAKKHNVLQKFSYRTLEILAFVLFLFALLFVCKYFGIAEKINGDDLRFLLIYIPMVFLGVFALFYLSVPINKLEWKILDPFKQIGIYTYWILCIHSVELICFSWYHWAEITGSHPFLGFCAAFLIKATIITCGCLVLKKIARWKYLKNASGKLV